MTKKAAFVSEGRSHLDVLILCENQDLLTLYNNPWALISHQTIMLLFPKYLIGYDIVVYKVTFDYFMPAPFHSNDERTVFFDE